MKRSHEKQAARQALKGFDATLPAPPPDGVAFEQTLAPLATSDPMQARILLKERARGFDGRKVPTDLPSMPTVNALSFTTRYLPGGRTTFLEFVKLAAINGDESALAWWTVYADLPPAARKKANFDDVCTASGIKPSALMAAVVGHGMEAMTDMGNLVASVFHPKVMQAMGESAIRKDSEIGAEDRKNFLQGRGFLPTPKGASIHLHANASANAQAASAASADPSVPKFAADLAALAAPKAQVQRQLAEQNPALDTFDAESVPESVEV